jgi:hypothetical protein
MKIFEKLINKTTENSPEILLAAGICGTVIAAGLACKATTKAATIIEEHKANKETIEKCMNETSSEEYSESDYRKDLMITLIQTFTKLAKTYAIPAAIEAGAILALLKGHKILKGRYLALGVTAELLRKHADSIAEEIERRYGKDIRDEITRGIKAETITKETIDEDGKKKEKKEEMKYIDRNDINSPYMHFFDATSRDFVEDREYNLTHLRLVERHATDILRASDNGKLTMNRVLEMLDLPQTEAGYFLGWDINAPDGDNFVDFGISEELVKTGDKIEPVILLNFNCNGKIVTIK